MRLRDVLWPTNWFTSMQQLMTWLRRRWQVAPRRSTRPVKPTIKPSFDSLERREVPATITFASMTGGDWNTAACWTGGVVPGASDDAVIGTLNVGAIVTHTTAANNSVNSITCTPTFGISSGSLTVATTSTFSTLITSGGTFTLSAGTNSITTLTASGGSFAVSAGTTTITTVTETNGSISGSGSVSIGTWNWSGGTATANITTSNAYGLSSGYQLTNDPQYGFTKQIAEASVSTATGELTISQPLDFNDGGPSVAAGPALVYNSSTIHNGGVVDATFTTNAGVALPATISVQLIWDGVAQGWNTYSTTGFTAGNTFVMGAGLSSAASQGMHSWVVETQTNYGGGSILGTALVGQAAIVNRVSGSLGSGWGIAGVDSLLIGGGGALWISGGGDARFFTGTSTFTSPAEVFGTLVKNSSTSYTYTAANQTKYNFAVSTGSASMMNLVSVVDPHSLTLAYNYDSSDRVTKVIAPDGATSTLTYTGATTVSIVEPGSRTVTLALSSGNVTKITDAAGYTRLMTYDGSHELTNDQLDPYNTSINYSSLGIVSQVYLGTAGSGETWLIVPAARIATPPFALLNTHGSAGNVTSPSPTAVTTYVTDPRGHLAYQVNPAGDTETLNLNAAGLPTQVIDGLGKTTTMGYDAYGDVTEVDTPAGSTTKNEYDATFHQLSKQSVLVSSGVTAVTTWAYNGTRDMTQTVDPLNNTTTNLYDAYGDVTESDAPLSRTSKQAFDGSHRLTQMVDALLRTSTLGYDSAGNVSASVDALGATALTRFDGDSNPTQTVDALSRTTSQKYDAAGLVTETDMPLSLTTKQTYDVAGQVSKTIDALNNTTTSKYDLLERLTEVDAPLGVTAQRFSYDSDNRVTLSQDPLGHSTTSAYNADSEDTGTGDLSRTSKQTYDDDGRVLTSVDAVGNTTTYAYNLAGWLTKTVEPGSRTTLQNYDLRGQVTSTVDPKGNTTTSLYDAAGQLTETDAPLGVTSKSAFDAVGNVTLATDPNGNQTTYLYDKLNRVTETDAPGSITTRAAFDTVGNQTQATDGAGNVTTYKFDALNRQTETDAPGAETTLVAFDANSNQTQVTDPKGNVTTYRFDALNRNFETDLPGSLTSTISFDADSNPTQTIDTLGNTTTNSYDNANELTQTVMPGSRTTSQAYDADGRVTGTVDALNHTTTSLFDTAGRVTEVDAPAGETMTMAFDADNNRTQSVDGKGNTTLYNYDAENRLTSTVTPGGETTSQQYDDNGQVTATVDANSNTTSYLFDTAGRLTETDAPGGRTTKQSYDSDNRVTAAIDALGKTTLTTFDSEGNVSTVVDPLSNTTTYAYNADNLRTQTITPNGYTATMGYDSDLRMTQAVDELGRTTTYAFDSDSRMTQEKQYDAGGTLKDTLNFGYNAAGDLTLASNGQGTYTLSYDADDRVTKVVEPFGVTLNMAYDSAGNRTQVTDSFGGTQTNTYDADNQLTSLVYVGQSQTAAVSFSLDKDGRVTAQNMYSAGTLIASTALGYDKNSNVTSIVDYYANGTTLDSFLYSFDNLNQVTQEVDAAPRTTAYTYDKAGQLLTAGLVTYGPFDANGNTSATGAVITTGNELTAFVDPISGDTLNYTFDKTGAETTKVDNTSGNTWTYAYDNSNHMISAIERNSGGTVVVEMDSKYNVFGMVVETDKIQSGATTVTRYAVDNWNPAKAGGVGMSMDDYVAVLNGSNATKTRNIHGDGYNHILGRTDNNTNGAADATGMYFVLPDKNGSTRDVLNTTANATPVDTVAYDAFGNILSGETGSTYRGMYGFDGYPTDSVTSLDNARGRVYDPQNQRWMSQDPIGFNAGDSNLYRYANNDPANHVDPSGFEAIRVGDLIQHGKKYSPDELKAIGIQLIEISKKTTGGHFEPGDVESKLNSAELKIIGDAMSDYAKTSANDGRTYSKAPQPTWQSDALEGAGDGLRVVNQYLTLGLSSAYNKEANRARARIRTYGGSTCVNLTDGVAAGSVGLAHGLIGLFGSLPGTSGAIAPVTASASAGIRIAQAEIQAVQQAMRAGPAGARWGVGIFNPTTGQIHIAHSSQALSHDAILNLFRITNRTAWRGFTFTEGGVTGMSGLNVASTGSQQMAEASIQLVRAAMRAAGLIN